MAGRIKFEEVKESVEQNGWKLLSETYHNLKADLIACCPQGHENHFTYEDWRKGKVVCKICNKTVVKKINEKPSKKKGYRILAFDQASITSGWAVFDDDKLINYGKWTSNGSHSTQRISLTKAWFITMIDEWKPDEVILEDIQLQRFEGQGEAVTTYKKLAHLQGVLKNYCYENGIPYKVVPPATWRTHTNIKGKTRTDKKRNAQLKVQSLYEVSVTQDEADAILICKWAADDHKNNDTITFT